MKFIDDNNIPVKNVRFIFDYKGYEIVCCSNGGIYVYLNNEEIGGDGSSISIPDAMEWIDEDIRCRKEE